MLGARYNTILYVVWFITVLQIESLIVQHLRVTPSAVLMCSKRCVLFITSKMQPPLPLLLPLLMLLVGAAAAAAAAASRQQISLSLHA